MPINFQIFLANFSFLTLFISMIFYWIQTSQFGKNQKKNQILQTTNGIDLNFNSSNPNFQITGSNVGILLMLISNFSIFIILILRWKESGHFPLSNLYESLMFLSWSLTFIHICIELSMN